MRYLKIASAKNPDTDSIELNDFNGFLCTVFQTLGISRRLEFLSIKNRQFVTDNKTNFKKYTLTVEILVKYSEYETQYRKLISFLDKNKKDGFRLYYSPYGKGIKERYCLCDIESSARTEKLQPVILTVSQGSLWLGEEIVETTVQTAENSENLFAFFEEDLGGEVYYSAKFKADEKISNYYCIEFYNGLSTEVNVTNNCYNEIPLNIRIYGRCVKPIISLFRKGEDTPIREVQIVTEIDKGYSIEVIANIENNGVWLIDEQGRRRDYSGKVNNEYGSPYVYVGHGEYVVTVKDYGNNACMVDMFYQEEYSE